MKIIFVVLFILFSLALLLGMYKPWMVLWFLSEKNRLKVLGYFGIPWLIILVILIIN
jgi:hypothetical protein